MGFERGYKVFKRVGLLRSAGVEAALTRVDVSRGGTAALAFKVVDDEPEVSPIGKAGKALCQRRTASYCGVVGQVGSSGQYNTAHAVDFGGLVQNVDLDRICANCAAVHCGVSARARFGIERLHQFQRGNVGVLNFNQADHICV